MEGNNGTGGGKGVVTNWFWKVKLDVSLVSGAVGLAIIAGSASYLIP